MAFKALGSRSTSIDVCYKWWWQFARLHCIPTSIFNCQSSESNDTIIFMQILLPTSQVAISYQCQVILPSGTGGKEGNIGVRGSGYRGSKSFLFTTTAPNTSISYRMRSTKMSQSLVKTPNIRRGKAKCTDNSKGSHKFVTSCQWRK